MIPDSRPRSPTHATSGLNQSSGRGGSNETVSDHQFDPDRHYRRNPTYGMSYYLTYNM